MRRILLFRTVLCAALVAAGCLPVTTTSPVGTSVGAKADPLLTGMWKGRTGAKSGPACFTFIPQSDGSMQVVVISTPTADDAGGWDVFDARASKLGAYQYMDAREIDDGGKPPDPRLAHVLLLYHVGADGFLVLYLVDDAAAKKAIASGSIAGHIESGEYGDVIITAPPAALDAFLQTEAGRALFTKPFATLERVE